MKKYIVNGKPVKAKSILDAIKKVKDKIINAEARNPEDLKKIIQSWTDRDDGIKVRVWLSKNTSSDIYYYHDVNGYYVIPTGVASTTTEYTHDRAKETALKYANKIFDSKTFKDGKVKDSKYEFDGNQFDIDELKEDAARYGLDVIWAGYGKTYFVKGQKEDISKLLQEYNMPKEVVNIKDANPLVQEVANLIKGVDTIFSARIINTLEDHGYDTDYGQTPSGYAVTAKKNGKTVCIISKNNVYPSANDIVQGNFVIGLIDSKTCKDESTKEKLIKLWAYQYGQSIVEAKKHIDAMTSEEIERKYKVLSQLQNSNAKKAFYEDSAIKDAEFKKGDKVKISNDFHIYSLRGAEGIVEYIDEYINVKFTTGPEKGETHPYTPKSLVKVNDSAIRDAYYNVGGYKSKDDKMLKQDIAKAKSYGLKTYLELIDGTYQLTVEGSYDKVKKMVEDYFGLDVSSIGDSNCKDTTISYKGYDIEFNFYGKNEYTVQYQGDDIWFKTIDEAKKFIDEISLKKDSIDEGEFTIEINGEIYEDQFGNSYHFNSYEKAMKFIKEHELKGAKVTRQYGKADSKSCKDMPYNGTSQVKEINKGYAIVLRSRWEKYGVNSGIETWEPSLDGAKAHKDSLTRADGLAFVIIDCNTKQVIDSKCKDDNILGRKVIIRPRDVRMDKYVDEKGVIYSYEGTNYDDIVEVKLNNGEYVEVKFDEIKFLDSIKKDSSCKDESKFMILNKDEGCYLYNVDISAARYGLTNNANKADKFTLSEANRIINILKKYDLDNLTTSEFLDSKCKDFPVFAKARNEVSTRYNFTYPFERFKTLAKLVKSNPSKETLKSFKDACSMFERDLDADVARNVYSKDVGEKLKFTYKIISDIIDDVLNTVKQKDIQLSYFNVYSEIEKISINIANNYKNIQIS